MTAVRDGGRGRLFPGEIDIRHAALHVASWYVGLTEVEADNKGPTVEFMLKLAGIDSPAPWCMAFVGMAFEIAGSLLNRRSALEAIRLQAYVQATVDWAEAGGYVVPFDELGSGDLFAIYKPRLERYAHIGFVSEVDRVTSRIITIEGNSNDEGSREGYEVVSLPRDVGSRMKFIRVPEV